jgi:hypothetical protein
MSKTLTVVLGIHFHVANGAGASVFERVYKERVRPVLSSLYKFPKFPAVLHFSGSLWYWIERNHNEILMLIGDMIRRKQLELLSGGFYEPMMPFISYNDKIGHIEMLTTYLRKHFGKRTHGCLLPEFAWDSSMPSVLASCNIAYTFLNEAYFFEAGLKDNDLYKPYISEDKGKVVTVFPFSTRLAGEFEKNAALTVSRLLEEAEDGTEIIASVFPPCFGDENSAGTAEVSALSFLSELSDCENKVNFSLPSRLIKNIASPQKIYFPYKAMKRFLVKYPETGNLYSKMVFVRALTDQLRGDKIRKRHAYEELWKAQDYSLYRGDRRGANQTDIRKAAYQALLEAEKITRCHYNGFVPSLMAVDFNFDGVNEYVFQGENINCFVGVTGARIFELDYLPSPWNYGVMAGVNGSRYMFSDTIVPPEFTPERARNEDYSGARLCGGERYDMTAMDRQRCRLNFKLPAGGGGFHGIEIEKTYNFKRSELSAAYRVTNNSGERQDFIFMTEINMAFPNNDENSLRIYSYDEYKSFSEHSEKRNAPTFGEGSKDLNIADAAAIDFQDIRNEAIVNFSSDKVFDAWVFSETASGGERDASCPSDAPAGRYESSRVIVRKRLTLQHAAAAEIKFSLSFYHY